MRRASGIIFQNKGSQVLRSRWYAQKQSTICLLCQQRARTCAAPFSSTASQKLRKRPTRASKTLDQTEEAPIENATEELVLGGERSRKEIEADAREYETRRRNEEREAFQKRVDDVAEQYYIKASNWDGMEMVGGEKEWPYGDRQHFQGHLPATRTTNIRDIKIAIHRATIEVYLAQLFRRPARTLPNVNQEDLADSETSLVEMKPSVDGNKIELRFPNETVRESVINSVAPPSERPSRASATADDMQDTAANEAAMLQEKARLPEDMIGAEQLSEKAVEVTPDAAANPSLEASPRMVDFNKEWGSVPISHPAVKLAIVRRIAHFTGHVFPDTVIQSASTVSDLSQYLVKNLSRPNKLYEELVGRAPAEESKGLLEELLGTESVTEVRGNALLNLAHVPGEKKRPLVGLPNVVVSGQRVTPIDKEKAVGRWKMIEAELEKRRLPVIGRS